MCTLSVAAAPPPPQKSLPVRRAAAPSACCNAPGRPAGLLHAILFHRLLGVREHAVERLCLAAAPAVAIARCAGDPALDRKVARAAAAIAAHLEAASGRQRRQVRRRARQSRLLRRPAAA